MARKLTRSAAMLCATSLILAGCEDFPLAGKKAETDSAAAVSTETVATTTGERDVERPDVFQVADSGLWDGRPSLGGVWVAHPDVKDPERVIIRNETTGSYVIGALFRRERDNPGPVLMVSSDAASALGIIAGQPTPLKVTALRKEKIEVPAAAAPAPEDEAAGETHAAGETGPQMAPAAVSGGTVTETALKPLDAAAAAIDEAEANAAKPAPKPAAPRPASSLDKPYLQIGIFSVEDNAQGTAAQLKKAGLRPTVDRQRSSGKTYWRVTVGPADSASERSAMLTKVKSLGFADAYAVSN